MLFLLLKLSNLLVSAINGKISVILCFDLLDLLNVVMLSDRFEHTWGDLEE